nr:TIGR02449 family protein [Pseudomonas aeruginosa]
MRPVAGAPARPGHWPCLLYTSPSPRDMRIPKREPMEDADLQLLTAKFDQLLQKLEQLKAENRLLRANEKSWREERAHLIEKNEMARHKVEAMILRLKALEQDT